jgi:glycosyltransferase involved in cell wall biosynthesis
MPDEPQLSAVIPAYNEAEGIAGVLSELDKVLAESGLAYEILVVDDGSTDDTASIAEQSSSDRERQRVLRHGVNRGYGAALKTGLRAARGEWVVITDADGTYPNDRIPELAAMMPDWDMVVGARTGDEVRVPLLRRPAKWALNTLAQMLLGTRIPDMNSGLRLFRRDLALHFMPILPNRFSFTTTITLAMLSEGYRVAFVPIDYYARTGRSKIRPLYDTLNFLQLIIRTVLYFNPLKVFLPLSLFFFVAGLAVGLVSKLVFGQLLDVTTIVLVVTGVQILMLGMLADLIDKRGRL